MATIESGTIDTSATSSAAPSHSQFDAALEKGREYLDSAVNAARENPWTAAAVGAGVVATAAATAYGVTKLSQRGNGSAPASAKSNK